MLITNVLLENNITIVKFRCFVDSSLKHNSSILSPGLIPVTLIDTLDKVLELNL